MVEHRHGGLKTWWNIDTDPLLQGWALLGGGDGGILSFLPFLLLSVFPLLTAL